MQSPQRLKKAQLTYFVPIRKQPGWLTQARLLPIVQTTADVMLSAVPNQPHDYTYLPQHEVIRQAPSQIEQRAANSPENSARHDPMAELIRKNETAGSVPKTTRELVQQKSAAKAAKSYGASDRQALDKLVQTGGSANR